MDPVKYDENLLAQLRPLELSAHDKNFVSLVNTMLADIAREIVPSKPSVFPKMMEPICLEEFLDGTCRVKFAGLPNSVAINPDPGDVDRRPVAAGFWPVQTPVTDPQLRALGAKTVQIPVGLIHTQSQKALLYSADVYKSLIHHEFVAVSSFPIKAASGVQPQTLKPYAVGTTADNALTHLATAVGIWTGRKELGLINVHHMPEVWLCVACHNGSEHLSQQALLAHMLDAHTLGPDEAKNLYKNLPDVTQARRMP
jgi:hypothetical protein